MWNPSIDYPFDEFASDFDEHTRVFAEVEVGDDGLLQTLSWARNHFRGKYRQAEAIEKSMRFIEINRYLVKNLPEFDSGTLAVRGSSASITSERLLCAVHDAISNMSDDEFRQGG